MNKKFKIKKGDSVIVIAGKDKGKEGEIVKVLPKTGKAVVEGVNIAIRHIKQSQNTQGGKIPQAMPIQLSNLALIDSNGKATRVGYKFDDGKKVRFAKSTGDII